MASGEERRASDRYRRRDPLKLTILEAGDKSLVGRVVHCTTADISATGLRLHLDFLMPQACALEMCVEMQGQPVRFHLTGVSRWSRQVENGFMAGVELDSRHMANLLSWQSLFYD